tara:strand:- start:534 stop:1112 length:579 start_codon:yes stop_codon:yes gene_type:complete
MPIKITVNKGGTSQETSESNKELLITVRKKDQLVEPDAQASVNLAARRTLDGNVLITDHHLIDILIQPANLKVITFTKNDYSDETYFAQSRLFDYLGKKGVIVYDSVQGGSVYGTLQAKYPEIEDRSALEAVLLTVGKWVNQEKADEFEMSSYEQEVEDLYTNPPDDDSTELGEVPHPEPKKELPSPLGVRY